MIWEWLRQTIDDVHHGVDLLDFTPGCDETVPQYVLSSRDRLDFEWGVLRYESRNRWSGRLFTEKSGDNRSSVTTSFAASNAAIYSTSVIDMVVLS